MTRFLPGNLVIVSAPDYFKGEKAAVVIDKQKWCEEGIAVYVADENLTTRYLCIRPPKDTIRRLPRKPLE